MALRIRKEVQDMLKASLDGTPEAVCAPAASPASPASPTQAACEAAVSADAAKPHDSASEGHETIGGRAQRKSGVGSRRGSKSKAGAPSRRKRKPATALGFRDYSREIDTIRTLFDLLIMSSAEPARLVALKSLTERYLTDEPSDAKLDQVRSILQRQAAIIRQDRESGALHNRFAIEGNALPIAAAGSAAMPESDARPMPDRMRRGEVETAFTSHDATLAQDRPAEPKAAEAKDHVAAKLPPEAKRRTILSWIRRGGGSGSGNGAGSGDVGTPGRPLRAKLKTLLMASVWIGVGGCIITYAGALIYVNVMRLEIDSALISGNIEAVNAPFDGAVTSLLVKAGDRVAEGQRFMLLEDPEVEKQVKLAAVKVDRAREDLLLRNAELESEKLKRDEYISISQNKLEKINSDISSLEKLEKVAQERFQRMSELFKKGIVIRPRLEEASDKLAEITTQLNKARINKKERDGQFENVIAGHFYDGNQVVGRLREAEAAVARATAEVDLAIEELQVLQQRRQVNKVIASHDSRILKVLRQEGAAIKRGDTVLVVERMDERVIHAFLRQEEISRIAIGDEATVYVPALRAKATARVIKVDRNAAFLDDVDARYSWKIARDGGPKATDKDRTARVTLQFDEPVKEIADQKFEIGMPTVVSFSRRSVNTVFSSFTDIGRKL
jgi:multidrug resistance efflux pump